METIETINQRLIDHYGNDSSTNRPMFRIVWANDQTEKRRVDITEFGIQLLHKEVREMPKYSYLKDLYVLEQLVVIPDHQRDELPVSILSYEPLWAFADDNRMPVPPTWRAAKFIIDIMLSVKGHKNMAKYVEDEKNTTREGQEQRIKELAADLFGNETTTTDALAYKEGVVVPSSFEKGN